MQDRCAFSGAEYLCCRRHECEQWEHVVDGRALLRGRAGVVLVARRAAHDSRAHAAPALLADQAAYMEGVAMPARRNVPGAHRFPELRVPA